MGALARAGVRSVVINTHHLGDRLPGLMAPHRPEGVSLSFVDEATLLGTGGGIRNALSGASETCVVMNGDIAFDPDLARAIALHERLGAFATMVVREDPAAVRLGAIGVDAEGRVRTILGDPHRTDPALSVRMFTGVHVLSPAAVADLPEQGCVIRQGYELWLARGEVLGGVTEANPWQDLGTLERYLAANLALADAADGGSLVHASARCDAAVTRSVVGEGAVVEAPVTECVVWPGSVVTEPQAHAIVTPTQVVPVPRA